MIESDCDAIIAPPSLYTVKALLDDCVIRFLMALSTKSELAVIDVIFSKMDAFFVAIIVSCPQQSSNNARKANQTYQGCL
jgi:hypothetical protein